MFAVCLFIIQENFQLNSHSLYENYIDYINKENERRRENDEEELKYLYTKFEITIANWFMKINVFMVLPASIFIYRSSLLSFKAFTSLKKHNIDRKGVAYSPCL